MFSTISARRTLARVAVAGAIAAIPLTALAMPASATPGTPGITQARHDPYYNNRCDFGPFQNWSCNNNPLFGWGYGGPPYGRGPGYGQQGFGPGMFGSS
ncbi:hypothetical protein IU427_16130 [Nocardia beijingensis]|uniref:hypothetical protein n=1 Tax=Nocardia beijingensis TaxID=95162 RepID=UPI00189528A7|nr:hypothetical protein [Nocardia beijingensis]MBF6466697.1 hypothetical protein [Nocardia beijingensis]